jgi:hypothetical protein
LRPADKLRLLPVIVMSSFPGGRTPFPPSAAHPEGERLRAASNAVEPITEQPQRAQSNPSGLRLSPGSARSPIGGEDANTGVQAAIEAGTRAEASLSALYRAIQQISTGVSGAREANEQLLAELERVRSMLGSSNEQRLALTNEVTRLAEERNQAWRALEEIRSEAARERAFLLQEQDSFIKELLEDHERALAKLASERDAAQSRADRTLARPTTSSLAKTKPVPPPEKAGDDEQARATIEQLNAERSRQLDLLRRLQTQRDQLQTMVDRLTVERDEARTRLAKLLPVASAGPDGDARNRQTEPPPVNPARKTPPPLPQAVPTARPGSSGSLRSAPLGAPTPPGGLEVTPEQHSWQLSPPPEELELALTQPSTDPPLKRKLDPTLRALGRYSVRPAAEVDAVPRAKPPRR